MYLRSLLAVTALATCSVGAAFAADLPYRTAPAAPYYASPPLFTWTGFYAGVNAGADFDTSAGRVNASGFTPGNGFASGPASGSFGSFRGPASGAGFVGGGQVGYNYQSGIFVYGVETDLDYFGTGGGHSRSFANTSVFPATGSTLTLYQNSGNGFLGTLRGRVGVTAFDRTLIYATGGLAYGDYGSTYHLGRFTNAAGVTTVDFSASPNDDTRIGYAVGAGVEYAITPKISAKAEYLYTDIGSRSYNLTNPNTGAVLTAKSDGSAQIARVGVNYKF